MPEQLQTWWQNVTPETQALLKEGALLLLALVGGHLIGGMVARVLRARNFDAVLRLPGSAATDGRSFTPTFVAGLLVRFSLWAAAVSWLAHRHGREELAATLGLILNRTWALATVLTAAMTLGSFLARRLMECLPGLPGTGSEPGAGRGAVGAARSGVAGAVGAGVYLLSILLVLLIAADLFDWPLTRASALALWEFGQHLLIAVAALFIGGLGARWARDMVTAEGSASPEKRAGQMTGLGIIAGTTILAVTVLLSGAGLLLGLAALGILGLLLWLVRGYLPDVVAGLQLRAHQVRDVYFEGVAWQVAEIGFLNTRVVHGGQFGEVQNRRVLEARMHGASVPAASR
jgi:hypothetical protein